MASMRIQINDTTIYEGQPCPVPRVGEDIHHNDEVVRIEAVIWQFVTESTIAVTLLVGAHEYTF